MFCPTMETEVSIFVYVLMNILPPDTGTMLPSAALRQDLLPISAIKHRLPEQP